MTTQSVLTRIPENTSFLQGNKFTFEFPTLPFLKYFCQTVNVPGIQTNPVPVETPFSNTYRHGDKLVYDQFEVTVIVDEDLRVWEESYNWLRSITFPHEFREYWRNSNGRSTAYHDGILTINTNANTPNLRFKFLNCHPVSMSGINFDTKLTAETTITSTISFRYDTYSIDRL